MKKIYALLFFTVYAAANTLELTVSGAKNAQMPLTILVLDETNKELNMVADVIKNDLQFTDQFNATKQLTPANFPKKELLKTIKNLCTTGTPLALCLNAPNKNSIEWRLYDTMQGTMIEGKKYKKQGKVIRGWAHTLADNVFKTLTGNEGFFSSRITYCKEFHTKTGKLARHIYIADFDGSNSELLVESPALTFAPRWNTNPKKPLIFYSENTDTNVRLMSVDMKKTTTIASDFDGINMLPGFSPDGKAAAYCASKGNGNCQLYYHTQGTLQSFTRNNGNNVSPIFIDNEHICFCSDAQTGNPQIYIGNIKTGHVQRITKGGYCTSPSFCHHNNTIAYHSKINGVMQICLYNCTTKIHTQVTKDNRNKHESSWSPDGTHLMFGEENASKQRIASLNLLTNTTKYLTPDNARCNYPHWSPRYAQFPVVM
jgi:TolB protein